VKHSSTLIRFAEVCAYRLPKGIFSSRYQALLTSIDPPENSIFRLFDYGQIAIGRICELVYGQFRVIAVLRLHVCWTEEVPNPKLVIIDTFQNVKPLGEQKTKNANAYEVDYYYLTKLHTLAKELNLCIIYVHHLNQTNAPHSWDKIMGSTGHQGVTDVIKYWLNS